MSYIGVDRAGEPNSLGSPRGSLPARRIAPFVEALTSINQHSVRDLCRTGHLGRVKVPAKQKVFSSIYIAWYVDGVGASLPQRACSVGVLA